MSNLIAHYTSMDAFFSILVGETLRTSYSAITNDPYENKLILDQFVEFARSTLGAKRFLPLIIEAYRNEIIQKDISEYPAFFISFSRQLDSLNQWVPYAVDGTGVALIFEPIHSIFRHLNDPTRPLVAEELNKGLLHEMTYDGIENYSSIFEMFLAEYQYFFQEYRKESQDLVNDIELLLSNPGEVKDSIQGGWNSLRLMSYFAKPPSFSHEQECRFTILKRFNELGKSEFVNFGPGKIRPTFSGLGIKSNSVMTLKSVVLGPKNIYQVEMIQQMLSAHGFSELEIKKSECAYI